MGHGIEDDVYSEWKIFALGIIFEKPGVTCFLFPSIAVIRVVTNKNHDTPFVVEDRAEVNVMRVAACVILFPGHPIVLVGDGRANV